MKYCVYCLEEIKTNDVCVTYKGKDYHKSCFDLIFPDIKEEEEIFDYGQTTEEN